MFSLWVHLLAAPPLSLSWRCVAWKASDGWLNFSGEPYLLWEELPFDYFYLGLELLSVLSTFDW